MSKENTPDHIADATKKVHPAPAPLPLPEEVERAFAILNRLRPGVAFPEVSMALDKISDAISDLTRRLAEAEKSAWEECHAMSSRLSKANQESNMWRNCAVYLDYRGADYCVAIHKELDGLQEDNRKHREQVSKLLAEWKRRAEAAEARVAELEKEACEALAGAHAEQEVSRYWKEEAQWEQTKRKCAEARVRELEAQLSGVGVRQYREAVERLHKAEARVRELEADNREVTREMLCIKAERDFLRERGEKLEARARIERRWETGFRNIVTRTLGPCTSFDISQIVDIVEHLWWLHEVALFRNECSFRGPWADAANDELDAIWKAALAATEVPNA